MYKLYLDDVRNPQSSFKKTGLKIYNSEWLVVRNYYDFVTTIELRGMPDVISFDHDLAIEHIQYFFEKGGHENPPDPLSADFKEKTGYDCAKWLCHYCIEKGIKFPAYLVHSHNPVGSQNIKQLIEGYRRNFPQL